MKISEVYEIMENELKCVQTADAGECDRECDLCPLVRDTDGIVRAYGFVLGMLEALMITNGDK